MLCNAESNALAFIEVTLAGMLTAVKPFNTSLSIFVTDSGTVPVFVQTRLFCSLSMAISDLFSLAVTNFSLPDATVTVSNALSNVPSIIDTVEDKLILEYPFKLSM